MKKLFIAGMALFLALSLAGLTMGQEKAKKEEPKEVGKSAVEKPAAETKTPGEKGKEKAEVKKEITQKPAEFRMGGIITAIDVPAKKITITQQQVKRERTLTLTLSKKTVKDLPDLKVGQAVNVWVSGRSITTLEKVS